MRYQLKEFVLLATNQIDVMQRQLGNNGPLVPALGFGCMGLSYSYGPVGDDESRFKVLDRALELGATFWDSSDVCESQV